MQVENAVDLDDQDNGETQEILVEPLLDLDDSGLTNNTAALGACEGLSTRLRIVEVMDSGLTNNTAAPATMLQEKAETRGELFIIEIFIVEYFTVDICFLIITWASFLQ